MGIWSNDYGMLGVMKGLCLVRMMLIAELGFGRVLVFFSVKSSEIIHI